MQPKRNAALVLSILMLSSGCLGLFGGEEEPAEEVDCVAEPSHPDCFVHVITEDDCMPHQVFTGDACRLMQQPSSLTYGESSILLVHGVEMQALTPSFLGDGPQNWFVNPRLPDGLSLDGASGVISGIPEEEAEETRHTIIGTNSVGSTATTIDITVVAAAPDSIHYLSDMLSCTLWQECSMGQPLVMGGSADSWSVNPSLPEGLTILVDGSITGIARSLGDTNHTITASNSGGSVEAPIRIITLHEQPTALSYPGHPFYWTIGQTVQVIPSYEGGEATEWAIEPPLPDGMTLHQYDGSLRGTPVSVHPLREYVITVQNTGGSLSSTIIIDVRDIPTDDLAYEPYQFDLRQGDDIGQVTPSWKGGNPDTWEVDPPLPSGFAFDHYTGQVSGTATFLQPWTYHTVWANNSGGPASTMLQFRIPACPLMRSHGPEWSLRYRPTRASSSRPPTTDLTLTLGRSAPHCPPD